MTALSHQLLLGHSVPSLLSHLLLCQCFQAMPGQGLKPPRLQGYLRGFLGRKGGEWWCWKRWAGRRKLLPQLQLHCPVSQIPLPELLGSHRMGQELEWGQEGQRMQSPD